MLLLRLLLLLSLNFCQAADKANSTQVFYTKMTIDKNALQLILRELSAFRDNNGSRIITDVHMTTSCTKAEKSQTCVCSDGNKWSDQVLQEHQASCNQTVCTLPLDSHLTCISNTTVKISGSITLSDNSSNSFKNCLLPKDSSAYSDCKVKLESALKAVYSTLNGLDTFTIVAIRVGSIIVDFTLTVVNPITAQDLLSRSKQVNISDSMDLETTGMVTVTVPDRMVPYGGNDTVICTTVEDLRLDPTWTLRRDGLNFSIFNGTVSTLTNTSSTEFHVNLKGVDKHWTGEYDCSFRDTSSKITVTHRANATIDICLKPEILSSAEPAFPHCTTKNQLLFVLVKCQITKSSEQYNVTWPTDYLLNSPSNDSDTLTYSAQLLIDCTATGDPTATCNFMNRCQQNQSSTFIINVIKEGDAFCDQDNEWQVTKAGFEAVLNCKNMAGVRKRGCSRKGEWEEEVSECVVLSLKNVLEKAVIADTGLGDLVENAAEVLHKFSDLTKKENLNTQANINASVSVYAVLNGKINAIEDKTTVNNFLDSSSNLLNKSLDSSWNSSLSFDHKGENDSFLAENYLLSVENLIKKSNIANYSEKENLVVRNCSGGTCDGLFNISVSLDASVYGDVKSVAYKYLQDYLPNNNTDRAINSLVVSTAANVTGPMRVVIDFQLQSQRPRDVELICVFWDEKKHAWSEEGCTWDGPSSEGRCVCTHLSSFAILMSKTPLRVPALSLLTTAGLSISIASLIISLAIEMMVWQQVVKTNTLYLRHTAHVNISVCLLVADICFLASSKPDGEQGHGQSTVWCRIFAVMKHFCYLAMFFWMLALSTTLLHQAVFLFHKVSKKTYLRFSIFLGYICPLLIVFITFLANNAGAEGSYFSVDTCWLVYAGLLKGSMFTFIIPMGIIVFFNTFSMLVVIMKLLEHHKNDDTQNDKEKAAAKTVIRSVVLLTPIFGLTWAFGLLILILDLTSGPVAYAVNYVFIVLNAFQGFYILLTTCLGDKMTREALLSRFKKKNVTTMSTSTVKTESSWKK
ncbi:hypothetical protein OJAV_G00217980 [Oryzias javanicus]|uniref:G-protein coupled receptors family 2 profile 2 domain-containing protein n=1 Tax=Oryzias javanicus TaxID=123683 RepID=A0A437C4J0_ORYJA|nr:hypothetical protein OJAV_G00217980 [Oryzias javanicus]